MEFEANLPLFSEVYEPGRFEEYSAGKRLGGPMVFRSDDAWESPRDRAESYEDCVSRCDTMLDMIDYDYSAYRCCRADCAGAPCGGGDAPCTMDGSEDDCSRDSVEYDLGQWASLVSSSVDAYGWRVDVHGATTEEQEFIEEAWTVLNLNTDLIKWAVCMVTGKPSKGDCIVGAVQRLRNRVQLTVDGSMGCSYEFQAGPPVQALLSLRAGGYQQSATGFTWAKALAGYIDICRDSDDDRWNDLLAVYRATCVKANRQCAVDELACNLLHELTHVCFRTVIGDESSGSCDTSYLIENAFRWALHQRYPDATTSGTSGCCSDLGRDSVLGSSDGFYVDLGNSSCVTSC